MRSYQDLLPMAARWRGLFSDFDDTLTHKGVLVPAAYDAIARVTAAGLPVVVVTGRPAGFAEVLVTSWPITGAIAENGAFAVRRVGRGLERLYWDPPEVRQLQRQRLDAFAAELVASLPVAHVTDDQWLRRCDLAFDIGERQTLDATSIAALTARAQALGAHVLTSSIHLHVFFGDHDKAKMCRRVADAWLGEALDATKGDYLYIGDSPNDQAGFAYFPHAAGVANVRRYLERLSPPPGYVADLEGGFGFAEVVNALLAARQNRLEGGRI